MNKARYVGSIEELHGKTALVQRDPVLNSESNSLNIPWLAQFDDMELVYNDEYLGYGWHLFQSDDFELIKDEEENEDENM